MAGKPDRDPRIGMMLTAYQAILASVPTDVMRDRGGPLSAEEIDQASEWMRRTAAEIRADRESPPTP